jgi:sterol desaturase/sphingolipid hydroxylase (fatty acid hydroxylase superfamily)|tara:strand:- start:24 stop:371 length:348 start_codon:yes stop_codon:yes gene_type:complete
MNLKYIITSALLFIIGQAIVWIQVNGPIIWPWAKEWRWLLMFLGVPITYVFMEATKLAVNGFEGAFWPGRFVSFVCGIIIFTIMTYLFRGESITMKTATCLTLAVTIIFIQLFWK